MPAGPHRLPSLLKADFTQQNTIKALLLLALSAGRARRAAARPGLARRLRGARPWPGRPPRARQARGRCRPPRRCCRAAQGRPRSRSSGTGRARWTLPRALAHPRRRPQKLPPAAHCTSRRPAAALAAAAAAVRLRMQMPEAAPGRRGSLGGERRHAPQRPAGPGRPRAAPPQGQSPPRAPLQSLHRRKLLRGA